MIVKRALFDEKKRNYENQGYAVREEEIYSESDSMEMVIRSPCGGFDSRWDSEPVALASVVPLLSYNSSKYKHPSIETGKISESVEGKRQQKRRGQ